MKALKVFVLIFIVTSSFLIHISYPKSMTIETTEGNLMSHPYYMLLGSEMSYLHFTDSDKGKTLEEIFYEKNISMNLDVYSKTWTLIDYEDSYILGGNEFGAIALKDPYNNIIIAFRGSDSKVDFTQHGFSIVLQNLLTIYTDEGNLYGHPQSALAAQFADRVISNNNGADFYVTGHSLGGNLAQYIAYHAEEKVKHTTTFNPLGIVKKISFPSDRLEKLNVTNYVFEGEILRAMQTPVLLENFGKDIFLDHPTIESSLELHSLSSFYDIASIFSQPLHEPALKGDLYVEVDSELYSIEPFRSINSGKVELLKNSETIRITHTSGFRFYEFSNPVIKYGEQYTIKIDFEGFEEMEDIIEIPSNGTEKNYVLQPTISKDEDFYFKLANYEYNRAMSNDANSRPYHLNRALKLINMSIEQKQNERNVFLKAAILTELNLCSSASNFIKEYLSEYPLEHQKALQLKININANWNTGQCVNEPLVTTGQLYKKWGLTFQGAGYFSGYPWAAGPNNEFYATSYSSSLLAIDFITRSQLARVEFTLGEAYSGGHYKVSAATGRNGRLYVGLNGKVSSFNSELKDRKNVAIDGAANPITFDNDGNLYVTTSEHKLYVISSDFSYVNSYSLKNDGVVTSPAIGEGGTIYVGIGSKLYAIKSDLSGEMWEQPITVAYYYFGGPMSTPVIGENNNIYISYGNHLKAVGQEGTIIGSIELSNSSSISKPVIGKDGTVYVTQNMSILGESAKHYISSYSSDLKLKEDHFELDYSNYSSLSEPVIDEQGNLFVIKDGETLYYINPKKREVKTYSTDTNIKLPSVMKNGLFYVGTGRGIEALSLVEVTAPARPEVNKVTEQDTIISGTAEVGSIVKVNLKGSELGRGIAGADGTFTITIEKQPVGMKLVVTATDEAGNESEGTEITVEEEQEQDREAPEKPVVSKVTELDTVVSGTAEGGSTVIVKAGATELGRGPAGVDGAFTITIEQQYVGMKLVVTATDESGNESEGTEITVEAEQERDIEAPQKPVVNKVSELDTVVSGTAEAGSTVIVKAEATELGRVTAGSDGAFILTIEKQPVGMKLVVTATDEAGNESEGTEITVEEEQEQDRDAPEKPVVNKVTEQDTVVSGNAEVGSTVIVKAGATELGRVTAGSDGTFTITIEKQPVGMKLVVTATDEAGNESEGTEITVEEEQEQDREAPEKPVVSKVTELDTVVSGTAEAGSTVIVKAGATELGRVTAGSDGTFTITIEKQPVGTKLIVTVTDTAGNDSEGTEITVEKFLDECFIATAAYGSKFTPAVELLRDFRDQFLLTNKPGQEFVKFYYKHSPPIAQFIAESELLKIGTRFILLPAVGAAYLLFHPALLGVLLGLISIMLFLVIKKKRKPINM